MQDRTDRGAFQRCGLLAYHSRLIARYPTHTLVEIEALPTPTAIRSAGSDHYICIVGSSWHNAAEAQSLILVVVVELRLHFSLGK